MHVLELTKKAKAYYESIRPKTMVSGFEKNILVSETHPEAVDVDSNYQAEPGDHIFRCRTINSNTSISLKLSIPNGPKMEEIALKGKFTEDEWQTMLKAMNGIIPSPEIDPRTELSAEMESYKLSRKIEELTLLEGHVLLNEIIRFWHTTPNTRDFIRQYI
jgi:hypothetical protein